MSTAGSWLKRLAGRSNAISRRKQGSGYSHFLKRARAQFSSPEPVAEALQQLVVSLASQTSQHLPRDKRKWLEVLVESPFLAGPLEVYADEFAAVGFQVFRPRNKGAITNAYICNSMPAGRARSDLVDELILKDELVPVEPDFALNQILTSNIRRWTGRRLRRMTMMHYASTGESFWRLGRPSGPQSLPNEALTLTPTEVIQIPRPGQDPNYRLQGFAGPVPPSEIFDWSRADPRNIYSRGRGLVQALGDELEGSEFMSRAVGVFFRNNNTPFSMMVYRGEETPIQKEQYFDRKHRGLGRLFRMAFHQVSGDSQGPVRDAYSIDKLGEPLDPAKMSEYARWAWEFVRQFLKVPPSMLANYDDNSGLGMSGIELERFIFLTSVMTPLVLDFEDTLQDLARHEYDPSLVVRHLPFVNTDREFQLRVMEKFEDRFTNNEIRVLGGELPMEDEKAGNAFLVRRGRVPVEDLTPGNEILEGIARAGGGQGDQTRSSSESSLPDSSNGSRFHVKRVKQLANGLGDVERQLARIDQELSQQRLK